MLELPKIPYNRYYYIQFLANATDEIIQLGFAKRKIHQPTIEEIQARRFCFIQELSPEAKEFYIKKVGFVDFRNLPEVVKPCFSLFDVEEALTTPNLYTEAKSFFDQVDLRSIIYAHIIAQKSDREIKESLESVTKYDVTLEALALFHKFFCNRAEMDFLAWKEWIHILKRVSFLEADLYTLSFSNRYPFELVKWKMHAKLEPQDPDKLMESFVSFLYFKSLECIEGADAGEYEIVQGWLERFFKAYEKHKVLGKGKHMDSKTPIEEAIFYLDRKITKKRSVLELGENVTKVQGPLVLESSKPEKSYD